MADNRCDILTYQTPQGMKVVGIVEDTLIFSEIVEECESETQEYDKLQEVYLSLSSIAQELGHSFRIHRG